MSYQNTRRHIVDTLTKMYRKFEDADFDDRQVMGNVHKVTSDMLYQIRVNKMIHDYRVQVGLRDFMRPQHGYEVDIKVWPTESQNSDNFILFVTPTPKLVDDDLDDAYARAMSIL